MSCKKRDKHHGDGCCEEQSLKRVLDLTTTPTPILIVNEGDGFSRKRTLTIQAKATPTATGPTVPATASFRLRIDGTLADEVLNVVMNTVDDGVGAAEPASFTIDGQVPVSAGPHEVALVASSDQPVDLAPGDGTKLRVCSA